MMNNDEKNFLIDDLENFDPFKDLKEEIDNLIEEDMKEGEPKEFLKDVFSSF